MIVIIEGPRGSGKTTIAKAVVEALSERGLQAKYWKADRNSAPPQAGMMHTILLMSQQPETVWVLDRFLLTEIVMSACLRRTRIDALQSMFADLNSRLRNADALTFIINSHFTNLNQRLAAREDISRRDDIPVEAASLVWSTVAACLPGVVLLDNSVESQFVANVQTIVSFAVGLDGIGKIK